jgi:hypothetical protein
MAHPVSIIDAGIPFQDVKCPRCSWTLLTGGMTEDAHEVVCGTIPGRKSHQERLTGMLSQQIEANANEPDLLIGTGSIPQFSEHPPFNIGENPAPQIGTFSATKLAGSSSASILFQFVFSLKTDFDATGVLKKEALGKETAEAKLPVSIDQPGGSVQDAVESLANELAQELRSFGQKRKSSTFNQFSATFMVTVGH